MKMQTLPRYSDAHEEKVQQLLDGIGISERPYSSYLRLDELGYNVTAPRLHLIRELLHRVIELEMRLEAKDKP